MNKSSGSTRVTNPVTNALRKWLDQHVPLMEGELSGLDRLDS